MKKLTILIPTYNRKTELLRCLNSIYTQGHFEEYNIIISDNHSEYNISEAINEAFPTEFTDIITVHPWSFNTGQTHNMSACILYVDTDWCWCISDDDMFTPGSIEHGLQDISSSQDVCAIRYSIKDSYNHEDAIVEDIPSYIQYYEKNERLMSGELFYIGLMYNMTILKPYLNLMTSYSYNYISFIVPFLSALSEHRGKLLMSSFPAYIYICNDINWATNPESKIKVLLGVRTFYDIPFNLPKAQLKKLREIVTASLLSYSSIYRTLMLLKDRDKRMVYYNQLSYYIHGPLWKKIACKIIFYFQYFTNINLIKAR